MKKIITAACALLLVVALAGCSIIQENPDRTNVAEVGSEKMSLTAYYKYAQRFFWTYRIDPTDAQKKDQTAQLTTAILDMMVNESVARQKMADFGVEVRDEDRAKAQQDVEDTLQEQKRSAAEAYMEEDPELSEEEALEQGQAYVDTAFSETYTKENFVQERLDVMMMERLLDAVTTDIEVSDEETRETFDATVAANQEAFDADIKKYVTAMEQEDAHIYYVPEGVYYAKHILIGFPSEVAAQIRTLRTDGNDAQADAMREESIALIQDKAQDVMALVEAGDDFDVLIATYGEDPGMVNAQGTPGYMMYPGVGMVSEFAAGADALADGEHSQPVLSDFGYHIIKRTQSVASGVTDYDSVKETVKEGLLQQKKQESYTTQQEQWRADMKIKTYIDRITYKTYGVE